MSCCPSGSCCGACKTFKILVTLVLTIGTVLAIIGVWKSTMTAGGLVFGSTEASLSILVAMIGAKLWLKSVRCLCPCSKASCCDSGGAGSGS